jgi:hypothetical protein
MDRVRGAQLCLHKDLPYALLLNRVGAWVEARERSAPQPRVSSIRCRLTSSSQSAMRLTHLPTRLVPTATFFFFRQQRDSTTAQSFSKLMSWILQDGQSYASLLHYAPLPKKVVERANLQLKQIEVVSAGTTTGASCKASLGLAPKANPVPGVKLESDTAGPLFSD